MGDPLLLLTAWWCAVAAVVYGLAAWSLLMQ
jgi:hypothetical protein